jgi:hypothetical protein
MRIGRGARAPTINSPIFNLQSPTPQRCDIDDIQHTLYHVRHVDESTRIAIYTADRRAGSAGDTP